MIERSSLPPRTSRVPRANRKRRAREWSRAYGSEERVEFVRDLACTVCLQRPSENAHIEGGGAGRKADATSIAPLCTRHHAKLHEIGRPAFEARYHLDLLEAAARTDALWRDRSVVPLSF